MTETQEQQAMELAVKTVRDYASRIKFAFGANSDAILLDSMEIVCLAALRASQVQTETTPEVAALEAAHKELVECVQRQWDGQAALKMSIPARPDHDSDLVIGAALRRAIAALRSAPVLRQQEKP